MNFDYNKIANGAIEHAKQLGISTLDYTSESIEDVEAILRYIHSHIENLKEQEDTLWDFSTHYGIYIGEVMLKNTLSELGFEWYYDGNMHILKNGSNIISPITKVYKRITNGDDDNVRIFYKVSISTITGDAPTKNVHRAINVELSTGETLIDVPHRKINGLLDFFNKDALSFVKLISHDGNLYIEANKKAHKINMVFCQNKNINEIYNIQSFKNQLNLEEVKDIVFTYYNFINKEIFIDKIKEKYIINLT